jgi:hypothetical protein
MRVEGYEIDHRTARCVTEHRIVARAIMPGRPWLSFTRKISTDGFHVTAHKTLRAAVAYGSIYCPNGKA